MRYTKTKSRDGRSQYTLKDTISWIVPGDIHLPFQDKKAVTACMDYGQCTRGLLITGDLLDYYWLSSWPKNTKSTKIGGLKKHREAINWFVPLTSHFDEVLYIAGNHEARLEALTRKYPGFDGNWWWMFEDILPKHWNYFDHGGRVILPQKYGGIPIVVEHGDRTLYGGVPTAKRLVDSYPNQCTVIGHNHKVQTHHKVTWKGGVPLLATAHTVGHLSDIKKNNYANNPDWQHGWAHIAEHGSITNVLYSNGKLL